MMRTFESGDWRMLRHKFLGPVGSFLLVLFVVLASARPWAVQARPVTHEFCARIGVRVSPMTRAFAQSLGMNSPYGAIFESPRAGGPAALAGVEAGDVVTAINGKPLASWRDFGPTIADLAPGTTAFLSIRRSGQLRHVAVHLGWRRCRGGGQEQRPSRST
jgi:membrane-associated protease RseP (regulator of RpoE activity)